MNKVLREMFSGESGGISSLRVFSAFVLAAILVSWFVLPDRSIVELGGVLAFLVGAATGSKISYNKHVKSTPTSGEPAVKKDGPKDYTDVPGDQLPFSPY